MPTEAPRSWLRRRGPALAASIAIAGGFGWLMRRGGLPVIPGREAFAGVRWWAILAYGLVYLASLYVRSHRWVWLLAPIQRIPLRRVVAVSFIGYGALVLLPFRAGEAVRPALIREKDRLSGWAATGTIAAERIIDGLLLSLILFVALKVVRPIDPLPDRIGELPVPVAMVPRVAYGALLLFVAAFGAMGVFYFWRDFARRATHAVVDVVSPRLAERLADMVGRLADGLGFLPKLRYTAPFLAATLLYYALNVAGIELLVWGVGLDEIDLARAAVIMGVLHLGVLLPNAPGFFGAFQVSVYAGLAMFISPARVAGPGAAVVFLLYVIQIGLVLIAAAVALFVEHLSPRAALAGATADTR